nr:family 20 glycosylhydrolase [Clostridia bacterium]
MYLSRIFPTPKHFVESDSAPFLFGSTVKMTAPSALERGEAENIKKLWNSFSFTASQLDIDLSLSEWTAVIGKAPCDDREVEYYTIKSNENGVLLRAVDRKSFIDGMSTLVQLIMPLDLGYGSEQLKIMPTEISDKPTIGFRAIHLCIFPETKVYTIEKAVKLAGFMKMTHVVLEFWGVYPYEVIPSLSWKKYAWSKQTVRSIADLCRAYGMEPIPMLNMLGHATQQRGRMGRHLPLNIDPRKQLYYEPDGWTWCLSNPDTYKLLSEMRSELCENVGAGSYFHIGFDEADSFATCEKCRSRVPYELFAEAVNRFTEELALDGRRPIMWHDELIRREDFKEKTQWRVEANGQTRNTDKAIDLIDRRVVIADWQYNYQSPENPTTPYFMGKGFDTLLCPWDDLKNIQALCDSARQLDAYGVIFTTWHHLSEFLLKMYRASNMMWQNDVRPVKTDEAAAILRKLHYSPEFESAGWNKFEVEQ